MLEESKTATPLGEFRLKIFEEVDQRVRETMAQMCPVLEQVAETHWRMNRLSTAIVSPMIRLQETMKPILDAVNASREPFVAVARIVSLPESMFELETFRLSPPRRYPSIEEVTEVVLERLKRDNQTKRLDSPLNKAVIVELPSGAVWDNLEMRLENQFDTSIYYKGDFVGRISHVELCFYRKNTRDEKPDKQWEFLHQLAITYESPELLKPTIENLGRELKITPLTCAKRKEKLAKKLRAAFGIEGNPFSEYDPEDGYQIRFKLRPIPELRGGGELRSYGGEYIENLDSEDPDIGNY